VSDAAVLEIQDVCVSYPGGGVALDRASLKVAAGEIVVVVGPNGAGKTTLCRAVAGYLPGERVRVSGSVKVRGLEQVGKNPASVAHAGVCFIPERQKVFATLTVAENLELGRRQSKRDSKTAASDAEHVARLFPILRERRLQPAGLLSGGEQQMLALARAFLSRPALIVIDEPSLGLAPVVIQTVLAALRQVAAELNVAVLLADQNIINTRQLATRLYEMRAGELVPLRYDGGHGDYLGAPGGRSA
jgi:branched-chain amino acid transport system ATP-binding protein